MRMPEPEEDKVTATGGGMRASGLLKLGAVRRSLLKKGLFVLQCALTESFHAVCCCACVLFFDRANRLSRLRLRAASNRAQETSELSTCLCARPHCACVCLVNTLYMRLHAMPHPLSVSQETIIIVLYYSVQSEVSAVRKLESPLLGSFFCILNNS